MGSAALRGFGKKGLRRWLLVFFLALAIPTALLIHQAYSELKWEAFHQHRLRAIELAARIDDSLVRSIEAEEARPFTDYSFLNVLGDSTTRFLQRSTLSSFPVESAIPGLIGYFQVDDRGAFHTPLLPHQGQAAGEYGIADDELIGRTALSRRIQQILSRNRLVQYREREAPAVAGSPAPTASRSDFEEKRSIGSFDLSDREAGVSPTERGQGPVLAEESIMAQAAFDRLEAGRSSDRQRAKLKVLSGLDLRMDRRFQNESMDDVVSQAASRPVPIPKKQARKEFNVLPETQTETLEQVASGAGSLPSDIRILTFASELDPFEFSLLDSGEFVIFRNVWREGKRYIQGALIEQGPFLQGVVGTLFRQTLLAQMSDLVVSYRGRLLSAFRGGELRSYLSSAREMQGALLYQIPLSAPLDELDLIFTINRLPPGPGGGVIVWLSVILTLVLCGGFYLMYRLGSRQVDLTRQQQDFVSAVSHELKTPLTSIRMYGEILLQGWAGEDKRRTYYGYIFDESERLSRLIENVLQLARMNRNGLKVELKPMRVMELMEDIQPRLSSQVERAGFRLELTCEEPAARTIVKVDADYFTQVAINLVDNAIKFAHKADTRVIVIGCALVSDGLLFTVRDYGPGVARDQMKKIFRLFYRSENELTRDTVGTGIGLALVHQLVLAMNGQVDVVNRRPGAEFRVTLPSSGQV